MARSKHDGSTAAWATHLANRLRSRFEATWWDASAHQYADSLNEPGNVQVFQKYWIGQTPMEAQLTFGTRTVPGLAINGNGMTALAGRENSCYSGERPGSRGLYHNGCGGGADGKGDTEIFSLTTSIQAIGEGNYGRLGPNQQRRYTDANAETMFSEPATGGTPDEQPGSMPEIFPSTPPQSIYPRRESGQHRPLLDLPLECHAGVGQLRDDVGGGRAAARRPSVPALRHARGCSAGSPGPAQRRRVQTSGSGSPRLGRRLRVACRQPLRDQTPGPQTPSAHDADRDDAAVRQHPRTVMVDGHRARHISVRKTNRGTEVTVAVSGDRLHTLVVSTA